MTWTAFNPANVGVQARDTVRSLIHDTKTDRQLLQNEEIDWQLTRRGLASGTVDPDTAPNAVYLAAAECAEIIAGKFAAESEIAITSVGAVKSTASDAFLRIARMLREKGSSDAQPSFPLRTQDDDTGRAAYETTYVEGIDVPPDLL